jgi:hypothetical protein
MSWLLRLWYLAFMRAVWCSLINCDQTLRRYGSFIGCSNYDNPYVKCSYTRPVSWSNVNGVHRPVRCLFGWCMASLDAAFLFACSFGQNTLWGW